MRIISGKFRGRRFKAPSKLPVRPTTDRAKEGLFNILQNWLDWDQTRMLDLCSGIGSISFEALSRGCSQAWSVDQNPNCIKFQEEMAKTLELDNFTAVNMDALAFARMSKEKFDFIFADPPYADGITETLLDSIFTGSLLKEDALVVIEHGSGLDFSEHEHFESLRKYGHVHFSFFTS